MLTQSTWSFPCPCKTEHKEKTSTGNDTPTSSGVDFLVEDTRQKIEEVGIFYFPKGKGPVYQDINFEPDPNFQGMLHFSSPFRVFLEITELCNLRCNGCYSGEKSSNHMSLEKIKKIIDDLKESGTQGVQLLGGEPTLHPDFIEICQYIGESGLKLEIVSNGMKINDALIIKIKDYVDVFSISIDGPREIHNAYRGSDKSYDRAINSFHLLRKHKIHSTIIMTISKNNLQYTDFILQLIKEYGDIQLKLVMSKDQTLALDAGERKTFSLFLKSNNLDKHLISETSKNMTTFHGCPGGNFNGTIDTKGNVYKCPYKRDSGEILGNLLHSSVSEVWNEAHNRSLEERQGCMKCPKKHRCGGLCDIHTITPQPITFITKK